MDDGNSVTTKLLTLLNVSATKLGKRKRICEDHLAPSDKLNKRKSASFAKPTPELEEEETKAPEDVGMDVEGNGEETHDVADDVEDDSAFKNTRIIPLLISDQIDPANAYEKHFGNNPTILTESTRSAADSCSWKVTHEKLGSLGSLVISLPEPSETTTSSSPPDVSLSSIHSYLDLSSSDSGQDNIAVEGSSSKILSQCVSNFLFRRADPYAPCRHRTTPK
jgi:U3 small nucleolar RNA-associated protein 25